MIRFIAANGLAVCSTTTIVKRLESIRPNICTIRQFENEIVVVVMDSGGDSFAYLKRLGSEVSPGVRILDNVGMKGSALAVATSTNVNLPNVGKLQRLWRVHGTFRL